MSVEPRYPKPPPWLRLRWVVAIGGIVAIGATLLVAAEAAGWPFLRDPLQRTLARSAGVPVALDGRFDLHLLWRPRLSVDHLYIGAGGGVPVPAFVDARQVTLGWRWRDAWRWWRGDVLRVQQLQADTLQAYLVRLADGRASWQLGRAKPADSDGDLPRPRVGELQVRDGLIVIDDAPLQTQLRIALQGAEHDDGGASGYQMALQGRWRALPLDLHARSGGALPLLQDQQGDPGRDVPLFVEGRAGAAALRFDGTAAALLGNRRLAGALRVSGPSLAQVAKPLGLTLPHTPPFQLEGHIAHTADEWKLRVQRAVIGGSLLEGDFVLHSAAEPPLLQGRLGGWRLRLADLGPAVGVPAQPAPKTARARLLPQRSFDLPSLHAMDADVQVAIDELHLASGGVQPLRELRTHLRLQRGVLRLQELSAQVAGGRFEGSTQLDANVQPARWGVDLRFATVDVARWVSALRVPAAQQTSRGDGTPPVRAYLTGKLSGAVRAEGRGASTAQILGSLDGQAQLMLRDGSLSHLATEALGLDVAESLGVLVTGDEPLPLRCGWMDIALQHGVAQVRNAVIDNDDTELRIEGRVDLRDESLALRMRALPKDVSPFTLRAPVTVGGSLAKPQLGIEGGALAGKAVAAVALGAVLGPLAAWLPFIDLGVADEAQACSKLARPPRVAGARPAAPPAAR